MMHQSFNSSSQGLTRPTLMTDQLILRPFEMSDAGRVQELAGHAAIARSTATIPHPYGDGIAERWISNHEGWFVGGASVNFAITLKSTKELIGCIDLGLSLKHRRAELGYWIGVPYWNCGYASESARMVTIFGFLGLSLNKVTSRHMSLNPASGRVLQEAGLQWEGHLRQDLFKDGQFYDLEVYGLTRDNFLKSKNGLNHIDDPRSSSARQSESSDPEKKFATVGCREMNSPPAETEL